MSNKRSRKIEPGDIESLTRQFQALLNSLCGTTDIEVTVAIPDRLLHPEDYEE